MTPITTNGRSAELSLTPDNQSMRVGETRRFALDIKSDVPLSLGIVTLRFDPKVVKVWVPNYEQFVKLQKDWLDEWNKIYGYRQ